MNKKGEKEMNMVGMLLIIAIGVIVAVTLLQASAQQVGQVIDLSTIANASLGTMNNGTPLYITGYKTCSSFKIFNATGDVGILSTNYTVTNHVVYNGNEAIKVDPLIYTSSAGWNRGTATYDGICQPLTYDSTSAGRSVAVLIVIMSALAIAVFALTPTLRSGILDKMGI